MGDAAAAAAEAELAIPFAADLLQRILQGAVILLIARNWGPAAASGWWREKPKLERATRTFAGERENSEHLKAKVRAAGAAILTLIAEARQRLPPSANHSPLSSSGHAFSLRGKLTHFISHISLRL